jgi:hypothetical protein
MNRDILQHIVYYLLQMYIHYNKFNKYLLMYKLHIQLDMSHIDYSM